MATGFNKDSLNYRKIGYEYVLAEDATLGDMFNHKVVIPKGSLVKVVSVFWMYGYKIEDNLGSSCWVWDIKELNKQETRL